MKAQALFGKPIISFDRGRIIGHVRDVIIDPDAQRLLGLIVVEPGVFTRAKAVSFEQVRQIGPNAVLVDSDRAITEVRRDKAMTDAVAKRRTLKGVRVVSEDGQSLGKIADVEIDEQSGALTGYVVSGGVFADAYTGTSVLPAAHAMTVGRDVAIVPVDAVRELEEQVGGIKGAMQGAKESATPKMRELLESAKGKSKQGAAQAKDVMGDVAGQAGDFARSAQEKAQGAWATAVPEIDRLRGRLMGWVEERRIKAVLGRPVARVIYSRDDEAILDIGELVTHEAVERARAEGALDMLLSSVSRRPLARFDLAEI